MTDPNLTHLRLVAERLAGNPLKTPPEVVNHLGAVQAQDFNGAKWAVAQRIARTHERAVDEAFAAGKLLRTHVLRPTWHLVAPENIRWMLELSAPRIKAASAYYLRQVSIDDRLSAQATALIAEALRDGIPKTKAELCEVFEQQHIDITNPLRATYLILLAEVAGLICSGPPRGKQQTYALIRDRAPEAIQLPRDEALRRLASMYFTGHGPATLKDFTWWSGLSGKEAEKALNLAKSSLGQLRANGISYWHGPSLLDTTQGTSLVRLIPNYDEYVIAYADRSAIIDPGLVKKVDERNNILFNNTILVHGIVRGVWRRPKTSRLEVRLFGTLSTAEQHALHEAIEAYADYLEKPLTSTIVVL